MSSTGGKYQPIDKVIYDADCPSRKNAYPSKPDAEKAARKLRRRGKKSRRLFAYRCDECEWWHLTGEKQKHGKMGRADA